MNKAADCDGLFLSSWLLEGGAYAFCCDCDRCSLGAELSNVVHPSLVTLFCPSPLPSLASCVRQLLEPSGLKSGVQVAAATVKMGNCLKTVSSTDDISLLRESPSRRDQSDMTSDLPPPYQETSDPATHSVRRVAAQLSEDEQVRMAQRMGLIQHLPTGAYDGSSKKNRECVICMNEFLVGETIRFLPCLHVSASPLVLLLILMNNSQVYHTVCIDDWLMRGSFTCPSCMEPVDAALLSSYQTD